MDVILSAEPAIDPTASVVDSNLGAWTEVAARTSIRESTLGDYSYVMQECQIIHTTMGKFCSIASQVRINPGNHPLDRAALHHFTYRSARFELGGDDEAFFDWRRTFPVAIGDDVWIGHGAVVLPGVTIGTGAAIGAGSVVTRDVAPFSVAVGNPARVIRARFPDAVQAALLRIRWWDWDRGRLQDALPDLRRMDGAAFAAKYDSLPEPGDARQVANLSEF